MSSVSFSFFARLYPEQRKWARTQSCFRSNVKTLKNYSAGGLKPDSLLIVFTGDNGQLVENAKLWNSQRFASGFAALGDTQFKLGFRVSRGPHEFPGVNVRFACRCQYQCFPLSPMPLRQMPVVTRGSRETQTSPLTGKIPTQLPYLETSSNAQEQRELARRKRCKHHFRLGPPPRAPLGLLLALTSMHCRRPAALGWFRMCVCMCETKYIVQLHPARMGYGSYWFSCLYNPPQILSPDIFLQIMRVLPSMRDTPISSFTFSPYGTQKEQEQESKPTLRPGDGKKPLLYQFPVKGPGPSTSAPSHSPFSSQSSPRGGITTTCPTFVLAPPRRRALKICLSTSG